MADQPTRVLLIDDDQESFLILQGQFSELAPDAFQLSWVRTYQAGREALFERQYDICLLCDRLEQHDGLELMREAVQAGCRAPIIVLTRPGRIDVDLEALRAGAADHLVKGEFDAHRLELTLRYALQRWELVRALEHERYLLHTLMDSLPDNIYFKDKQGHFIRINRAKARRSGLSDPEQAVGKTDFDFFPSRHAQRAKADEEKVMRSCHPIVGQEEKLTWPDGTVSWVSTTKVPFRDEHGDIIGTLGVSRDITRLKQAQEDLRHAKEAAEAASRAKSEFLANMSHEIRTPLNAVLGMTELVLDSRLTDSQREYLTMVQDSGEALLAIINDILDFSKIEAGKVELQPEPISLRESLGEMMRSLGPRAHHKQLELAYHIAPDVPDALVADRNRLRQLMLNLVGNAIKFTDEGEVVVHVVLDQPPDAEVLLHFQVTDTGIGIPHDKLEVIFKAFEQVDTSMTRRFGGTGLGLAIARRLVESMGGRIWAESEPGHGSSFHFKLPCRLAESDAPDSDAAAVLAGTRVLAVDDNQTNLRILAEMLGNWGMDVATAAGAEPALAQLRAASQKNQPFRVLVSDVNMPATDGFTLAATIRRDPQLAGTVVILLTSGPRHEDPARSQDVGAAAYLIKPVKQSELFNLLVKLLGTTQGEPTPAAAVGSHLPALPALRILLAEDSPFNQRLALGLLQKHGHSVEVVNTGVEALAALAADRFDMVLMDVQMPDMDGLEATSVIRRRESETGGHVPIVAMTAHALKGDQQMCLNAGMDAYVAKPIHARLLFETMADVLARLQRAVPETNASDAASPQAEIDWEAALHNIDGRVDLMVELVEIFFTEYPALLASLDQALVAEDPKELQLSAHRLKGCLKYFGVNTAAEVALELEKLGRSGSISGASKLLEQLRCEIDRLLPAMRHYSAQHGGKCDK